MVGTDLATRSVIFKDKVYPFFNTMKGDQWYNTKEGHTRGARYLKTLAPFVFALSNIAFCMGSLLFIYLYTKKNVYTLVISIDTISAGLPSTYLLKTLALK